MNKIEQLERNLVISALRPEARAYVSEHAVIRRLSSGEILYEQGDDFEAAVFPISCVVSLMVEIEGLSVESANLGREGFVGAALLFRDHVALSNSTVRVPGDAAFVSMAALEAGFEMYPCIRKAAFVYSQRFIGDLMRTVACVRLHRADRRVALWLRRAFDRVEGRSIEITHQSLASALGQRRATVTDAFAELQRMGAIATGRGSVTVIDPVGLEAASCSCYARLRALHTPMDLKPGRRSLARRT